MTEKESIHPPLHKSLAPSCVHLFGYLKSSCDKHINSLPAVPGMSVPIKGAGASTARVKMSCGFLFTNKHGESYEHAQTVGKSSNLELAFYQSSIWWWRRCGITLTLLPRTFRNNE